MVIELQGVFTRRNHVHVQPPFSVSAVTVHMTSNTEHPYLQTSSLLKVNEISSVI